MADADDRSVHRPVQVENVRRLLALPPSGRLLDLTLGAGGHTEDLLGRTEGATAVGVDRDPAILEIAARRLAAFGDRVRTVLSPFDRLDAICDECGADRFDAILIDLGVSSLQLDDAERGFSFDRDGPLEMRMGPDATRSAADLVNRGSRDELMHAVRTLGDEPRAARVVEAILEARRAAPIRRTCELADLVKRVVRGPSHHHPATRTFQGLRMAVNDELGMVQRTLPRAIDRLREGGRLAVLAFHGGEDRLVKRAFRDAERAGLVRVVTPKPLAPEASEVRENPRARSSRLRVVERVRSGDDGERPSAGKRRE